MIKFRYGNAAPSRESIGEYLKTQKSTGNYSVVDIGGSDDPWSKPDVILDIRKSNFTGRTFIGNINDKDGWLELLEYVVVNGKFDFSVCSHTLEDIAYPALTLRMLPLVSKAGYIVSPSHFRELSRNVEWNSEYRGFFHHRWILVPDQNVLTLVPKISALEYIPEIKGEMSDDKSELQVWWAGEISFRVFNDDYLGPSQPEIIEKYKQLLRRVDDTARNV